MTSWLETYKPVASSRMQLWLAAAMLSGAGLGVLSVGTYWLLRNTEAKGVILMGVAACLGLGKSFLILDRTAHLTTSRIKQRGEGRCLGGFFSPRLWMLVVAMMLLGRLLRTVGLPPPILGLTYTAVGLGLLFSSRILWRAWKNHRPANDVDLGTRQQQDW